MSQDELASDETEAVGWDAIDKTLEKIYGNREPQHYGTVIPAVLGGKDPLQGISAYKNLEPIPHYHFVTYGFSELFGKESDDSEISGYGFELTFRLACEPDAGVEPPSWSLNFLQNLARYVFQSGNAFDERHHLSLNGPIAIGHDTRITAITLALDPQLGAVDTPNGRVKFLQIIGLCSDEYEAIQQGYFKQIFEQVTRATPFAITSLQRPSILAEPSARSAILSEEPDVNQRELYTTIAQWEQTSVSESSEQLILKIGATAVTQLKSMLKGIVAAGEPIAIYGNGTGVVIEPGENVSWKVEDPLLFLTLPESLAHHFAEHLQPTRGEYQRDDSDPFRISVVPVNIRDGDGKIINTVG